jgi:rsbT co-antagonist protein RsbR
MHDEPMAKLRFDENELRSRREFFELTDDVLRELAALKPFAMRNTETLVEGFYELLLRHPETRRYFPDEPTIRRVKKLQADYFLGLFEGRCDMEYVAQRLRVGAAHERIGMPPKWYLGGYRKYLALLLDRIGDEFADPIQARTAYHAVKKIVAFDMSLAIDTYIAANLETLGRHQAAIRELSTPVIRVHDGVLLLPLVGAIDSQRAQQVMETCLVRAVEERAKAIIVDIAGVPVVDTKVADHLLETTSALRMLGTQTILTGISAQVARTIVKLGVDVSSMRTLSRLADGIELGLSLVGKQITDKPKTATP